MSTEMDFPLSMIAGEDMDVPYLRVKANGRTVNIADAKDYGIGVNVKDCDSGEHIAIRGYNEGSCKMVASGAITAGRKVYAAAGGKVAATGTLIIGTALDTASGNNSVIGILPHPGLSQSSSSSSSSAGG